LKKQKTLILKQWQLQTTKHYVGHIKAIQYIKNKRKNTTGEEQEYWNNFKLILGNEIYLTRNNLTKDNYEKGKDKYYHFILLAKDAEGHKQLRELSSRAWSHSFRQFIERVPTYKSDIEEVIGSNPGHVIMSTACLGSEFAHLIMEHLSNGHKNGKKIDEFVSWCQKQCGKDNFYIELQSSESDDQAKYNDCALAYCKARNLKAVITTDAHYINREDRPIHKAFLNAGEGDREVDEFYSGTYLQSVEDIKSYVIPQGMKEEDLQWLLDNTIEVANKIEEYDLYHQEIVPKVELEQTHSYSYKIIKLIEGKEYINNFINSESEQDKYYINGILYNLEKKIKEDDWKKYIIQIEKEVAEVWEISLKIGNELSSYFNTMSKIIDIMWTEGDSLVGVSRGSAGGFVSNYLLRNYTNGPNTLWN
jgi:DNA polymerase-3 subunit alpha